MTGAVGVRLICSISVKRDGREERESQAAEAGGPECLFCAEEQLPSFLSKCQ